MNEISHDIAAPVDSLAAVNRRRWGRGTLARLGGVTLAFLIVGTYFSIRTSGELLALQNLFGILRGLSSIAIMGMGLTVVIIAGEIDLSFAAVYGLSTNLVAVLWIGDGWPVYLAILVAFLAAIAVGVFNAFFTVITKIPSFIATLGSSTLIFGLTLLIGNTQNLSYQFPPNPNAVSKGSIDFFTNLAAASLPHQFPEQGLWTVALLMLFGFLLSRTLFGFRLKAIGGSRSAAEVVRLPVRRYIFIAFIVSACMGCLAGILDFSFVGSAGPDDGQTFLFPVFAAVIIGGTHLSGGKGSALGTITGALLLAELTNGFALLAAGPFASEILLGSVTIGAVVIDRFTAQRG
jgi:ribose/xylose/arabinose/galactoside ABC-type transport system permease subunit